MRYRGSGKAGELDEKIKMKIAFYQKKCI